MVTAKKAGLGFLIVWFGCWIVAAPGYGAGPLSDQQKKERVYRLYDSLRKEFPHVNEIDVARAKALYQAGQAIFIDARSPKEMAVSHLPGAVSVKTFLKHPESYRHLTPIAYCTISYRSGIFAQEMAKRGVTIVNLRGGILAWTLEGEPVYHGGQVTRRLHVYDESWNLAPRGYDTVVFKPWEKLLN
jgi:rhodanese-related sulfurtransferase